MPYHRSEEHTSELQSHDNLVCRLLLEKKKKRHDRTNTAGARTQAQQPARATHGAACPRGLAPVWRPAVGVPTVFAAATLFFFRQPGPPETSSFPPPAALRF